MPRHDRDPRLSPFVGAHFGVGPDHRVPATNMPPFGGYQRYREMDVREMLLENRILFLSGPIDNVVAGELVMRMLLLQQMKRDQDINLYLNCPGGTITDTLMIVDTMNFLTCKVATYAVGQCASGGALLLAAGAKGKRFALPHAEVMIHQPYGGIGGQASDIEIQAEQILKKKKILVDLFAKYTGQAPEKIEADSERDRYMDAPDAVKYGLIDEVITVMKSDD
jgi:ATP-dependent Clp protease protease subunit